MGRLWNDHFINVREIRLGHLTPDVARELLMKPVATFPENAISREVADLILERTGGQPFLIQLFGKLLVQRVNHEERRQATLEEVSAVEAEIMTEGDAVYFFRNTSDDAAACAGAWRFRRHGSGSPALAPMAPADRSLRPAGHPSFRPLAS